MDTKNTTSERVHAAMIGRKVRYSWTGDEGTITKWEPFGASLCDAMIERADGSNVWIASYSLTPTDGRGPLPERATVRAARDAEMLRDLEKIRASHAAECRPGARPWPGAEFAKAIVGRSIDGAIADVRARTKGAC